MGDHWNEKKQRRSHVLMISFAMLPSVYLCGHCQLTELSARGLIDYRHSTDKELNDSILNWADIVVIGRMDNTRTLRIARKLKSAGKTMIYMLDDDLLNVPAAMSSGYYYSQTDIRRSIIGLIDLCDAIMSPSPLLLEKYASDKRQIIMEEPAVFPVTYAPAPADRPVRIGFAGSVDHKSEMEAMLYQTLKRVRTTYGSGIELIFFGFRPDFAEELDIRTISYCASYDMYRKQLNGLDLDIGLAPLPRSDFHACKHYNKFTEYSAAGIVGIYSAVPPYDRLQAKGLPGLFCADTSDEWYAAIARLVDDAPLRESMRQEACRLAHTTFSNAVIADELWRSAHDLWTYEAPPDTHRYHLHFENTLYLFVRLYRFLRKNGLNAPAAAMRKLKG